MLASIPVGASAESWLKSAKMLSTPRKIVEEVLFSLPYRAEVSKAVRDSKSFIAAVVELVKMNLDRQLKAYP